jgi:hypothetical protein
VIACLARDSLPRSAHHRELSFPAKDRVAPFTWTYLNWTQKNFPPYQTGQISAQSRRVIYTRSDLRQNSQRRKRDRDQNPIPTSRQTLRLFRFQRPPTSPYPPYLEILHPLQDLPARHLPRNPETLLQVIREIDLIRFSSERGRLTLPDTIGRNRGPVYMAIQRRSNKTYHSSCRSSRFPVRSFETDHARLRQLGDHTIRAKRKTGLEAHWTLY